MGERASEPAVGSREVEKSQGEVPAAGWKKGSIFPTIDKSNNTIINGYFVDVAYIAYTS